MNSVQFFSLRYWRKFMKNILCFLTLFFALFTTKTFADNSFFDELIIDNENRKQIEEQNKMEESKTKASEILDKKIMDLQFEQKKKEVEEEKEPEIVYDPAPFGLLWLAPKEKIEQMNVVLTPKTFKDSPNSFIASNLPKPVSAFESVLVSFGENDILWRIAGYGLPMEDDDKATKGLKEYQKFYDIFNEKYGNAEEFYTAAVVNVDEEVMLKDGSKSHIIKQKFIEKGDDDFKEKLMSGDSVLYAIFRNDTISVTLALMANGEGKTFIMVDYRNLKINDLEHEKMLDAL